MKTAVINEKEIFTRQEFAKKFIGAYDEALKIMQGKLPRSKMTFDDKLKMWQKWADEGKQ
jgi:hypothetical protein